MHFVLLVLVNLLSNEVSSTGFGYISLLVRNLLRFKEICIFTPENLCCVKLWPESL